MAMPPSIKFCKDYYGLRISTLESDLVFCTTDLFSLVDHTECPSQAFTAYQEVKIIQMNIREPANLN